MFFKHQPRFHLLNVSLLDLFLGWTFTQKSNTWKMQFLLDKHPVFLAGIFGAVKCAQAGVICIDYLSRPFAGILLPSCSSWTLKCVKIVGN